MVRETHTPIVDDPLWYKDAVIYELHVKSFYDHNNDGIGDFRGLFEKLDYLESLGVTAVWLLPFYPSPLRDDGYDIADYYAINPDYGTLRDFRQFLREAHKRGIRVITELVINHTSDQHPWFQRARRSKPGSVYREYYVWSDTPDKYHDARIIFSDFETSNWSWDPVARAYYWHRFYRYQPDLNFDNPRVQKEIFRMLDFWFDMGVDGLRLDAIPYLFEREQTNCENLDETHVFLRKLRQHVDDNFKNRMLLAEANQWPEDAVEYFGEGEECHMAFHFPVMPRLFMGLRMEERFPIVDILEQTPQIEESCQWAMFLRNHDELTLEMVTDEERDYMYRVFAYDRRMRINLGIRRRLAPLLDNDRRKIELMNVLLFSLPGTPVIYYGDEIGMGDNYYLGDRDGVRTPMQWNPDRNAGFSKASFHKLYLPVIIESEYHSAAVNVDNQENNASSLLWWMRRIVSTRKSFKAFGRGSIEFQVCENPKVLTFVRHYEDEAILVVINLSNLPQVANLELKDYSGMVPEEIFSGNHFPAIMEHPYTITLGPYDYFWFLLNEPSEAETMPETEPRLALESKASWRTLTESMQKARYEKILLQYVRTCRWFGGKARPIRRLNIRQNISLSKSSDVPALLFLEITYADGAPEFYLLPISFATTDAAIRMIQEQPQSVIAWVKVKEGEGVIYDGAYNTDLHETFLNIIGYRKKIKSGWGQMTGIPGKAYRELYPDKSVELPSRILKAEQSNTSILYDNVFFLKLFRRLDKGVNPDCEILRVLTEKTQFKNIPAFAGTLELQREKEESITLGILQELAPNEGDAWRFMLGAVDNYLDRALTLNPEEEEIPQVPESLEAVSLEDIPPQVKDFIGGLYLEMAGVLGQRTAQFHRSMISLKNLEDFAPEPFSKLYQRSVYQSLWSRARQIFRLLKTNLKKLPGEYQEEAQDILSRNEQIIEIYQKLLKTRVSGMKIRIHGDYHLGQVLFTGKDFILIDFEGEPMRPLSERKLKRSALRDVAGMIRSFHYAAYGTLFSRSSTRMDNLEELEYWINLWYSYMSKAFLDAYIDGVEDSEVFPADEAEFKVLFDAFLLDKAIYELDYEMNNRPSWILIPIRGIQQLLKVNGKNYIQRV